VAVKVAETAAEKASVRAMTMMPRSCRLKLAGRESSSKGT